MGILLDTLAFFLGSCPQELGEKGYLTGQYFDTCNDFLPYISGPCEAVFELQDDIAHSEVQDSLMCSAGRTSFCLCDLVINDLVL